MTESAKELLKIVKEHPDLEIVPIVNNELVDYEYGYTVGEWGTATVGEYCECDVNGRGYDIKAYTDREEFKEDWIDSNLEWLEEKYGDDISIDEAAEKKANGLFKPAIIVYVI